jgi:hypothetical protein
MGKGKGKLNKRNEGRHTRQVKDTAQERKITLRSSSSFQKFDTFCAQRDELLHQSLSKERHEQESLSTEQSKNTGITTSIIRRASRSMGIEGNTDIFRLL